MASGRPDWYSSVAMHGKHNNDYITVNVDELGNMLAKIQGLFGATLKTIAVDTNGIMKANLAVQDLDYLNILSEGVGDVIATSNYGGNGIVVVHTVNPGKTLYLGLLIATLYINIGGNYWVGVRDDGAVEQYHFLKGTSAVGQPTQVIAIPFSPVLKIGEDWDISLWSNDASLLINAFVFGYEK
uniref:Uncharacterized protein n=1 Tax=viral metagenome TaxID=1070528 RepID=A0A6H1ZNT6_9ZZZZ